jgi:hypothetical protein
MKLSAAIEMIARRRSLQPLTAMPSSCVSANAFGNRIVDEMFRIHDEPFTVLAQARTALRG